MKKNILITCGGSLHGLTIIKELNELQDVIIHVCDNTNPNLAQYFTPFVTIAPDTKHEQLYAQFIIDYVNKHDIYMIIPAFVYDLRILAGLKNKLNVKIAVPDIAILNIFLDKRNTYKWLKDKNLPTFDIIETKDLAKSFPLIGKQSDGFGSKGLIVINNAEDLNNLNIGDKEELIWTKYYSNIEEYSIDICFSFEGIVSQPIIRIRHRVLVGFAVIMDVVENSEYPELLNIINDLAKNINEIGGVGFFNIQIIKADYKYFISDINPRIGTSSVAGKFINNNLCQFLLTGKPVENCWDKISIVRSLEENIVKKIDLTKAKAIVFDLDDTLISHKKWIFDKLKKTAYAYKSSIDDIDFFIECANIAIDEGKTDRLFDILCDKFKLNHLKNEIIEYYKAYSPENISVYNDVLKILVYLKSKYKLIILTDNPIVGQKQKLALFPYLNYFDEVVFSNSINLSKPDKKVFEHLSTFVNIPKEELIMVGDNYSRDIKGSLKSGFLFGFQIVRNDSLFNSSELNIDNLKKKYIKINTLNQLSWYL